MKISQLLNSKTDTNSTTADVSTITTISMSKIARNLDSIVNIDNVGFPSPQSPPPNLEQFQLNPMRQALGPINTVSTPSSPVQQQYSAGRGLISAIEQQEIQYLAPKITPFQLPKMEIRQRSFDVGSEHSLASTLVQINYSDSMMMMATDNDAAEVQSNGSSQEKKFRCTEPGCNKSFTRRYNLHAHYRCHRSEKPFECTQCTFKFARKHDLTRHIRSLHEMKRSYGPCQYCNAYFTRSDALARHLKVEQDRRGL